MEKLNPIVTALATFSQMAISLTAIIALLSTVFKPVRNFVKWFVKKVFGERNKNEEVLKKIDEVETKLTDSVETLETKLSEQIQEVSDRNDENEKDRIRWEILDFANSCRNGRLHTKEEFDHIIALRAKYENLLKKTGDTNGVFQENYKYIQTVYAKRLEKNDFLV